MTSESQPARWGSFTPQCGCPGRGRASLGREAGTEWSLSQPESEEKGRADARCLLAVVWRASCLLSCAVPTVVAVPPHPWSPSLQRGRPLCERARVLLEEHPGATETSRQQRGQEGSQDTGGEWRSW